jgi:hypothetical protein
MLCFNYEKWRSKTNGQARYCDWSEELQRIMKQIGYPTLEGGEYYWIFTFGRTVFDVGFDLKDNNRLFVKFFDHGKDRISTKYDTLGNSFLKISEFIYVLTKEGYIIEK